MPKIFPVNVPAAQAMVEELTSIERKVQLMKQYINPARGTVIDVDIACSLCLGMQNELDNFRSNLIRFL